MIKLRASVIRFPLSTSAPIRSFYASWNRTEERTFLLMEYAYKRALYFCSSVVISETEFGGSSTGQLKRNDTSVDARKREQRAMLTQVSRIDESLELGAMEPGLRTGRQKNIIFSSCSIFLQIYLHSLSLEVCNITKDLPTVCNFITDPSYSWNITKDLPALWIITTEPPPCWNINHHRPFQ